MDLGPRLGESHTAVLRHVLDLDPQGWALEFGVASGHTLRLIAERMPTIGFDSFDGLPETWREGFPAGMFACPVPDVPGATIVPGLFADTLPGWTPPGPIGLVHVDCDLASSTRTILTHICPYLEPGCVIVYDEYHGWPGWDTSEGEMTAWLEYAATHDLTWEPIGHGPEQFALRLT